MKAAEAEVSSEAIEEALALNAFANHILKHFDRAGYSLPPTLCRAVKHLFQWNRSPHQKITVLGSRVPPNPLEISPPKPESAPTSTGTFPLRE